MLVSEESGAESRTHLRARRRLRGARPAGGATLRSAPASRQYTLDAMRTKLSRKRLSGDPSTTICENLNFLGEEICGLV